MTTTTADAVLDSVRSFLDGVNIDLTAAGWGRVAVASGGSLVTGQGPAVRAVTSVRVGRALDTMRSRRASLLEGYRVQALAA
jgi:hypothetical protein